jgi:putative transposase
MFLLSPAPTWLLALDKTTEHFLAARDAGRSCRREIRTCRRKCALTPTTHHSSATNQTTTLHEDRSTPAGASGKGRSGMEASPLDCSTGDASQVAPSGLSSFLEAQVESHFEYTKMTVEIIALIKEMAKNNRLWGAERIRGELLKLDIHVCKRTIQKYMRGARTPRPTGQSWRTFLRNHGGEIWACDFLQVTDLFFRSVFAFFIIELRSRKVIHVGVTRSPTDAWTAQQLREATPYGQTPKYLIRDHDSKFGPCFARVAATSGIKILKTPYHAQRANAICERFLGSVRRECLDHLLILHEKQLHRMLNAYMAYFNRARPHQGMHQQIPEPGGSSVSFGHEKEMVIAVPILGGLHHDYQRGA